MSIDTRKIIGTAVSATFEGLETRRLLAAAAVATVTNHQLRIQGTPGADQIEVKLSNDGSEIWTKLNGIESPRYNAQMIYSIHVDAGDGNNRVAVDQRINRTTVIITGSGNDTVISGAGNDSIQTGAGNDFVDGGLGNDSISTGTGKDQILGGGGDDTVNGGSGNDWISADGGRDRLFGKKGNDRFFADHDDQVDGGSGKDLVSEVASFEVINVIPSPSIHQLSLVNTETGKVIAGYENLGSKVTLDLSKLPASFTVAARAGSDVKSVLYATSDGKFARVSSGDALAMTGYNGKLSAWNPKAGTYTLTATPYAAPNARGFVGELEKVEITVINGAKTPTTPATPTYPTTPTAPTTPTNNNTPGAAVIALRAMDTTIEAGQSFHIEATGTTVPGYQIEDAKFSWDFGDEGSRYNTLAGFNAAHVYERAGTYTVRLTVTVPGGKVSTATSIVTVKPATINRTIYVSNGGSDSNDGRSSSSPVRSIAQAIQLAGSDSQILVKRGDTFNQTSTVTINGSNIRLGTYGSGNAPRVVWTGDRSSRPVMFYIPSTARDVTVRGFTFDSIYSGDTEQTGMVITFNIGAKKAVIRDNTFLNVGYALNMNLQPAGIMVMDNNAPLETGVRDYFCWVQGTDIVIVGNNVANSTREHIVRVGGGDRVLIANNRFTNLDRSNVDPRDTAKGAIVSQKGSYSYIANNEVRGPAGVGPLGENDGLSEKWARFRHSAVEGNVMYNATFFLQHGAENVTFRDNTFFANDMAAISVKAYNSTYQRGVVDLVLDHNVAVNNGTTGNFLKLEGRADQVTLTNNVYVAPYLKPGSFGTAAVSVAMADLSGFRLIGGNVWPSPSRGNAFANGGIIFVGLEYTSANHYDPTRWNAQSVVGDDQFIDVQLDNVIGLTRSMLAA